jgi:HEAT repeat protein
VKGAGAIGLLLLACAVEGCGGTSADQWFKERLWPPTPATRVSQLESPNADQRREALRVLAAGKNTQAIPSVVTIFCTLAKTDKDPTVRDMAVQGLAGMQGDAVLETLTAVAASDRSPYVRREAVMALGRRVPPEGAQAIIKTLKEDSSVDVRLAAAEALSRFREKAAAEALVAALEDSDLGVATRAWEGLRYMTGQNLPREVQAWAEFMVSADDPFTLYGKPPPMPRGVNQRPTFTKGPAQFIRNLFAKDVLDAEMK